MMRRRYLGTAAIAALLAIGGAGAAHAVPSYAYATLQFTNFKLTGVVDAGGAPLTGVTNLTDSVTVSDGSNYPGAAAGGASAAGSLSSGANPPEATSGPGPFPGQDVYSQGLTGSSGTRSDAQITNPIATGATSNLVAEGNLTLFGASAGSNAGSSTTLKATFTAMSSLSVTLSFNAFATIKASVGALGDSANPQTSAQYTLFDITTGTITRFSQPTALNLGQSTTDPTTPVSVIGTSAFYTFTDTLTAGDTYQLTLADSVTEILSTATPSTVPEPMSLAVLGVGLMGLGSVVRRRQA